MASPTWAWDFVAHLVAGCACLRKAAVPSMNLYTFTDHAAQRIAHPNDSSPAEAFSSWASPTEGTSVEVWVESTGGGLHTLDSANSQGFEGWGQRLKDVGFFLARLHLRMASPALCCCLSLPSVSATSHLSLSVQCSNAHSVLLLLLLLLHPCLRQTEILLF